MATLSTVLVLLLQISILNSFIFNAEAITRNATVYFDSAGYKIKFGVTDQKNGVAFAVYEDRMNETGWGELNIVTGEADVADQVLMHAAGYLEGALTASRIHQQYDNIYYVVTKDFNFTAEVMEKAKNWFQTQDQWTRKMIMTEKEDPLWHYVGLLFAQFDGLVAGYQENCAEEEMLDVFAFQMLNGIGDLIDLRYVLNPESQVDWDKVKEEDLFNTVARHGHCSALVKILDGYENIFAGHVSWFTYSSMLRIFKHYNLKLRESVVSMTSMSFSSYPGFLESLDDFYMMDNGVVLLQTTNNVFNRSLYQSVVPESLLAWQRLRVANMMSSTGSEWAEIFKMYNSGTYNNQYMVLDLKKVHLKSTLEDGALWVVEQIPTLVVGGDQTVILRKGYWPSYNVPFYEQIYNMSGYPEFVAKHGTSYSYELAPRAKIFRREQSNVKDIDSFKYTLRYNKYNTDPYSEGNPMAAICSRGDLADPPLADGCYDGKVTDYAHAQNMMAQIINGPTWQDLPPFSWKGPLQDVAHEGQPTVFNFPFITVQPMTYKKNAVPWTRN